MEGEFIEIGKGNSMREALLLQDSSFPVFLMLLFQLAVHLGKQPIFKIGQKSPIQNAALKALRCSVLIQLLVLALVTALDALF